MTIRVTIRYNYHTWIDPNNYIQSNFYLVNTRFSERFATVLTDLILHLRFMYIVKTLI